MRAREVRREVGEAGRRTALVVVWRMGRRSSGGQDRGGHLRGAFRQRCCSGRCWLELAETVVEEVVRRRCCLLTRRPRPIKVVAEALLPPRRLDDFSWCERLLEESEFARSWFAELVARRRLSFLDELVLRSISKLDCRVEEIVVVVLLTSEAVSSV